MFKLSDRQIETSTLREQVEDPRAGAVVTFEGVVRNHNEGHSVTQLEYEAFEQLALKEGERILTVCRERYSVINAVCVHRTGKLSIGEVAVWVGVSTAHRADAFTACRFIIDEIKHRLPIWKKEHYSNGDSGWVNCQGHTDHEAQSVS